MSDRSRLLRGRTLVVVGIIALISVLLLSAVVPGFLANPSADQPPPRIFVDETTIETESVTGESATLNVTLYLRQQGGSADEVTATIRAIDQPGGLLTDSTTRTVEGDLAATEQTVPLSITVPREGGYTIRTIIHADGQRVEERETTISGVQSLTPPYAESSITFQEFANQPSIEYEITDAGETDTQLRVTSYLHNQGNSSEANIQLRLTARQAESGVVAARSTESITTIGPGKTEPVTSSLSVPAESNYYLDATLWRDGVVIESTRGAANLDPQRTIDVDETQEDVDFDAGDFETDRPDAAEDQAAESGDSGTPGFGLAGALIAIVATLAYLRRGRSQ